MARLAFVVGLVLAILIKGYDVAGFPQRLLRSNPIDVGPLPVDCGQNYTVEILSVDPVVLYINNFLTGVEIEHLLST
jgi:hypothetical protein